MTALLLGCAALLLVGSLFFFIRPARTDAAEEDLDRANLAWFRRRQQELEAVNEQALVADARLRLLEDEHVRAAPRPPAARPFPVWTLLPLMALLSGLLYYHLGAASDVVITKQLQGMRADMPVQEMRDLMQQVQARALQRPTNVHYLALLGRYYMTQKDYAQAAVTYNSLVAQVPDDAQALAYAAQAQYLADGRTLSAGAQRRAEQALALAPSQRTALSLLGMAAFEQQRYQNAIDYWQRLLATAQTGSADAQMIAGLIDTARGQMVPIPAAGAGQQSGGATASEQNLPGLSVAVLLPPEVAPTDTVFVLARNADTASRMPIAVLRYAAADLPAAVRLDDSNSMAGQKLSQTTAAIVAVQVSPQGRPGAVNARWLGEVGPLSPSDQPASVVVQLKPNAQWQK